MEIVEAVTTKEQHCMLQMNKKEQEMIDDFNDILKLMAHNIEKAAFERKKDLDEKLHPQHDQPLLG
jgi:hypothetical protein